MRKKDENLLQECLAPLAYAWRHRSGIKLFGKKLDRIKLGKKEFYLDHEVPALIQDCFNNLPGFTLKDGTKPVLAAKRKTEWGWHLVFNLPPGISFSKVRKYREVFQDAANAWIEMSWDGKLHMDVYASHLPHSIPYDFDHTRYPEMDLPVPVGVSQRGIEVFDLAESPHLLVAGVPGFGKSNFLHVLIHSLLPRAFICIIDLKRLEFAYLRDHCLVTRDEADALRLMQALNREMERRIDILEAANVVKVQDYQGDMPHIVLVIDEVAEIKDDKLMGLIDRIVRLARAVGISVVAATQRPSVTVIPGDTRAMFAARLCYQVADETNSRIVLGDNCPLAAHLPGIKGRGIFKYGMIEREVQTMYLPLKQAKELLKNFRGRGWDHKLVKAEPSEKRLKPR